MLILAGVLFTAAYFFTMSVGWYLKSDMPILIPFAFSLVFIGLGVWLAS